MFERKEVTYDNKKYYYSNEYLRKMYESYNSQREHKENNNNNIIFKKILNLENVTVSNDQPKILFRKYITNTYFENKMKKQLEENNGFLTGDDFKKKLKKYLSHTIDRHNRTFKKFPLYNSKTKNRYSNYNLPKPKNLFSKCVSKNFERPPAKNKFYSTSDNILKSQNNEKKFPKRVSNKKKKSNQSQEDKKLLMNKLIKNGIKEIKNGNKSEKESFDRSNHKKKLNFLIENNVTLEEINKIKIENKENLNTKKKNIPKSRSKSKTNKNLNNIFIVKNKQNKQIYKPTVDQFEYLTKIHKEVSKIRSSKSESKIKGKGRKI